MIPIAALSYSDKGTAQTPLNSTCSRHVFCSSKSKPTTFKGIMAILFIWLLVGELVGWIAGLMEQAAEKQVLLNVGLGMTGSLIGGWLISPLLSPWMENPHDENLVSILVAMASAVILLTVFKILRRRLPR